MGFEHALASRSKHKCYLTINRANQARNKKIKPCNTNEIDNTKKKKKKKSDAKKRDKN